VDRSIYRGSIRVLSVVFIAVGLAILISTFAQGGGPLSLGTLLGIAFTGIGILRLRSTGLFRG
jgi:hypothetical protein